IESPTLRVVALFWTLCVLSTTQSVENGIPTLERAERYFPTIVHNAQRTSVEFIRHLTVTSDTTRHEIRCP
ncbi:hypothetical protein, partial [Pseudomonas syringae group genomosp. 3]|uniref:hypothetical protein n=1 Tax=Pseudomonas syringae group genomosp. 3 TaxID=251701 RepID=UPI001C816580